MEKRELRLLMKKRLSSIDKVILAQKSSLLSKNLKVLLDNLRVIHDRKMIGTFAPIESEPHWFLELDPKIHELTGYPVFETDVMSFKKADYDALLVKRDFGVNILGPADDAPKILPEILLIPGLAFSHKGERLGRGKGFYDKFLSQYRGVKIGLGFSVQFFESLPTEEHDVTLDYIVTEEKIINCSLT